MLLNNYCLQQDRTETERSLTTLAIKRPSIIDKIPTEKFTSQLYKTLCSQIKAIQKKHNTFSIELLYTYAIPRLVRESMTEDQCRATVDAVVLEAQRIEGDGAGLGKALVGKLKEIEAKELALKYSALIEKRVLGGDDAKSICNIGNEIAELGSRISNATTSVSVGDAFQSLIDQITVARTEGSDLGVPYPIGCMTRALGTLYPSDLIVIAARPAVGKTALGLNFCRFSNDSFGFISSEMSKEQLAMRFVGMDTGIPSNRLRDAKNLTDYEMEQVSKSFTMHKGRNLYIEDKGAIHIGEIEDAAESWVNLHGIKVLIVDYAQRINSDRNHQTESERIGHVTKRLKELAKRLGICVVLLAQINRDAVKGDRRPQVHDIKGSGDIEQEADTIILLHKPSMGTESANQRCIVEMIIDKNRHGKVGILLTEYISDMLTFAEPSEADIASYKEAA